MKSCCDRLEQALKDHAASQARVDELRAELGKLRARKNESELLLQNIVDAWTVAGPNPKLHYRTRRSVYNKWPCLAKAIENAVMRS